MTENPPTEESSSASLCDDSGEAMHRFIAKLYPICRSITGNGVRASLDLIREHVPITIHEVPSGLRLLDWTMPPEWNIRDAYIKDAEGRRIVSFQESNLHVMSYSRPIQATMTLAELKPHLFSSPNQPNWIPYRACHSGDNWGFCLAHNRLLALPEGDYDVCIDSSTMPGYLTYGEYLLRGRSQGEVLVSCHISHPSLCNDNLSGIAVAAALAQKLPSVTRRYSYRFLFVPSMFGSIAWLALNSSRVFRIKHGLVLYCVGDRGNPTYKKSRRGNAEIDDAVTYTLKQADQEFDVQPFSPDGYDEVNYCSPGFDLPVGCFMRTPWDRFPERHTSADNLEFVHASSLRDSLLKLLDVIDVIENNRRYINQTPYGEPELTRHKLFSSFGGRTDSDYRLALRWVLNYSDGAHTLLDIARRGNLRWDAAKYAAQTLRARGLLRPVEGPAGRTSAKKQRAKQN